MRSRVAEPPAHPDTAKVPGYFAQAPVAIQRLPLDLLRSSKYPRDPSITQEGIRQYFAGELPVAYFSQRAAMTKWKTPPYQQGWGQNVIGMQTALRQEAQARHALQFQLARVPIQTRLEAVRRLGAGELPQPTDRLDANLRRGYVPLAAGAVPLDQLVSLRALQHMTGTLNDPQGLDQHAARRSAMASVDTVRNAYAHMLQRDRRAPWFIARGGAFRHG